MICRSLDFRTSPCRVPQHGFINHRLDRGPRGSALRAIQSDENRLKEYITKVYLTYIFFTMLQLTKMQYTIAHTTSLGPLTCCVEAKVTTVPLGPVTILSHARR